MKSLRRMQFIALGTPEPKGSTKIVPHCRFPRLFQSFGQLLAAVSITSDNRELKQWAGCVRSMARVVGCEVIGAKIPVRLVLHFSLPRPQRLQTKKWLGVSLWHTTRPDLDKLERAVKDALTGVCYDDDGQVAQMVSEKCYVDANEAPCVHVTVEELEAER
jgi:Holliday junction resolvase RusA-like endonuclease